MSPVPADELAFSLVLPAYNEARRLPRYLASIAPYLDGRYGAGYEVIVVDDGSRDGLGEVLHRGEAGWPPLRIIAHAENQGKGAAVRSGVLAARGRVVLFADADGATPIDQEARLAAAIEGGADAAVGSRLLHDPSARRVRHAHRGVLGRLFSALARRVLGLSVRDSQCGFKMFRRPLAQAIFSQIRETRYLFDLEALILAQRLGARIAEVPIDWEEVPGSHLHVLREAPKLLAGLWRLRRLAK